MRKKQGIWKAVLGLIVAGIILNRGYFYLSSLAVTNKNIAKVATILAPVISALNYIIIGFAAGIGFYLAKQSVEK